MVVIIITRIAVKTVFCKRPKVARPFVKCQNWINNVSFWPTGRAVRAVAAVCANCTPGTRSVRRGRGVLRKLHGLSGPSHTRFILIVIIIIALGSGTKGNGRKKTSRYVWITFVNRKLKITVYKTSYNTLYSFVVPTRHSAYAERKFL